MRHPFDPPFEQLPATLPVFPLPGALLLPRGRLPLTIFEPRYLNMVRDALRSDRFIGMIQPAEGQTKPTELVPDGVALHPVGCAGRIVEFSETDNGQYLIALRGLVRFAVEREVPAIGGYRRVVPDFERFRADMESQPGAILDRPRLVGALKAYLAHHDISVDWDAITQTADERLVISLAMICPFEPCDKQSLLESADLAERSRLITALLEMATIGPKVGGAVRH